MGAIGDALTSALGGFDLPDRPSAVDELGTAERQSIARDEAGIQPGAKLPARGTEQRRAYDSSMRRLQRYVTEAGEKRTPPTGERLRQLGAGLRRFVAARNLRRARDAGLTMGLTAWIRVSQLWKRATMPAGGGAVDVDPGLLDRALDAWEAGNDNEAEAALTSAFFVSYWDGFDESDAYGGALPIAELGAIESVNVGVR